MASRLTCILQVSASHFTAVIWLPKKLNFSKLGMIYPGKYVLCHTQVMRESFTQQRGGRLIPSSSHHILRSWICCQDQRALHSHQRRPGTTGEYIATLQGCLSRRRLLPACDLGLSAAHFTSTWLSCWQEPPLGPVYCNILHCHTVFKDLCVNQNCFSDCILHWQP